MSIIIFIIILGVLIFVHELGHFIIAKKSGIRVDEFAVGFPPQIFSITRGGTKYALNLIPFGGYVKIYGENSEDESFDPNAKDSFVNKNPWIQAAVLVAGVTFNIIFAWFLFWIVLMAGSPTIVDSKNEKHIKNSAITITSVMENSPAKEIGLKVGDKILTLKNENGEYVDELSVSKVQEVISQTKNDLEIKINRAGQNLDFKITPKEGIVSDKPAIGISLENIGIYSMPIHTAFYQSFIMTGNSIQMISAGLFDFFGKVFLGKATFDQVAGPVGIVGIVGEAASFGLIYLLSFTAFISINLAVLNILPFPALDGGRLVIVFIESLMKRKIKPSIVGWINGIGFLLLILLMIIITIKDIAKLF